jgi:ribose transport system substrate-binding protein
MHSLMLVPPAGDDLQAFHSTRSTIFARLTRIISILISSAPLLGMVLPQPVLAKPFRIGVSNAFVDTWRSQMLDALNKTNDELKGRSLTSDLIVQSANIDIQGQVAQIRFLLSKDIDALLFIPSSESALNSVLTEATRKGIKAIAITQEVSSPGVLSVMIDQAGWARTGANWVVKTLNGAGSVVIINGLAGAPANESRFRAVDELFKGTPQLKILNVANGDWDEVRAQNVTSTILAAQPSIDAIWVSGAMSEGVLKALLAANRNPLPAVTGDSNLGYLRLWQSTLAAHQDFKSIGVIDPPGLAATTALRIVVRLLEGKKIKADVLSGSSNNRLYIPLPGNIEQRDLEETLEKHAQEPDSRYIDVVADEADVSRLFEP